MTPPIDLPHKRSAAKALGKTRYFTGIPCVNGHVSQRLTSNGCCITCSSAARDVYRTANPEKFADRIRSWRAKNADHVHQFHKDYIKNNPDKKRKYDASYKAKKKLTAVAKIKFVIAPTAEIIETRAIRRKQTYADWHVRNKDKQAKYGAAMKKLYPGRYAQYNAARRARKRNSFSPFNTPENKAKMDAIYEDAKWISDVTGELHHVDHIIPLKGKNFSGLHVHWNLRIITAAANMKKHTTLPEGATGLAFLTMHAIL